MSGKCLSKEEENFRKSLFIRWTDGLSPIESRISIFSHIRDIPYAIVPEWNSSDDIIRLMIRENKGWCGPKHNLLMWMFGKLGIKTEPVLIPFRWQEQPVNYPDFLKKLLVSLPDSTHLCCKAYLDNQWHIVDATWDIPLKFAGFPVNNSWDGFSEMNPAVSGISSLNLVYPDILSHLIRMQRIEFVTKLNKWLEEVRLR